MGKEGGRKKRNNEYIFPLSTFRMYRVYPLFQQRPGNLIPFSIYLNPFTQTPLPTSSTFGLFLSFSACLPSAAVTSQPLFVSLHGAASFHSSSPSERRHTFPPLLASFTNVASRIFGWVLNKVAEEGGCRGGRDWLYR